MMFAWSPPFVITPWMRASVWICWRMASSALKSEMTALSALTPRHGHDEACAAWPKNSTFTLMMPRLGRHTCVPQRPWIIMAASTPSKTPASISFTLPAPPSSAGVPMTWMRPANGSVPSAARAAPAPTPAVAMTLWPHAWPMPGSASYSAMMAIVGPAPEPGIVARNAVASPPTPRSTRAPCVLDERGIGEQVARRHRHDLGRRQHPVARQRRHRRLLERARVDRRALRRDLHHGLDGGDDLAHVADVGAAHALAALRRLHDPERLGVGTEEIEQRTVAPHRLVRVVGVLDHLERGARRFHRALGARDDALLQGPHVVERGRAHVEGGRGELRDDVGGGAAAGHDAVDARVRPDLLAQHADVVERLDHAVERVDALPRIGGGVRGLAGELEADTHDAEQVLVHDPAVEAVDHHRGVYGLEDAAVDQLHLAAAALFRGRTDDLHAALRQPVPQRSQRRPRADAGGGDDVVAAGVTDPGQRVVLAEDRDRWPVAGPDGGAKRRRHAGHPALDREALLVEELGEPRGRLDLLVRQLGIVVDLSRQLLEIVGKTIDRLWDEVFDSAHDESPGSVGSATKRGRQPLYTGARSGEPRAACGYGCVRTVGGFGGEVGSPIEPVVFGGGGGITAELACASIITARIVPPCRLRSPMP